MYMCMYTCFYINTYRYIYIYIYMYTVNVRCALQHHRSKQKLTKCHDPTQNNTRQHNKTSHRHLHTQTNTPTRMHAHTFTHSHSRTSKMCSAAPPIVLASLSAATRWLPEIRPAARPKSTRQASHLSLFAVQPPDSHPWQPTNPPRCP